MFKRKKGFTSVASALSSALSGVDSANMLNLGKIGQGWEKIVGPQLSTVALPGKLGYRELTVLVKEPVWADSMLYIRAEIAKKVNDVLGKEVIDRIRIRIEPDAFESGGYLLNKIGKSPLKEPAPEPTEEEKKLADEAVKDIEDLQLRSIMRKVIVKSIVSGRIDRSKLSKPNNEPQI